MLSHLKQDAISLINNTATCHTANSWEAIYADLTLRGWSVYDGFIQPDACVRLSADFQGLHDAGAHHQAGIGPGANPQVDTDTRSDRIFWLGNKITSAAIDEYLAQLDDLRISLNRSLYLGLDSLEIHHAVYPPGGYYRKHLDQFKENSNRIITCILYLNQDWLEEDGGLLRMYTDQNDPDRFEDIMPLGGRLVCFLSNQFEHEVLPTKRERHSITGWFKSRPC